MSLATRIRLLAVLALTLCVFAMPIFTSPTEANVASACVCKFGGFDYSDGACLNGQTCVCNYSETGCICKWISSGCD
jgi:hypothetical protein